MRTTDLVTWLSFLALAFPSILLFQLGERLIYPHYLVLMLAIPLLFLLHPMRTLPVAILVPLLMMVISTIINASSVASSILVFHLLHLLAIMLLARAPLDLTLKFAKITILAYVFAILAAKALELVGLQSLVQGLLVTQNTLGQSARIAAFATEPSYAGLIMLILGRFIILFDPGWMTIRRVGMILSALILMLSLYAILSAFLLLLVYLEQKRSPRALLGVLFGGVVLMIGLSYTEFFALRLLEIDTTLGLMGLGSGTIRLLPYIYLFEVATDQPWVLLWGGGAGAFQPDFFANVGQFFTNNATLTAQLAASIYDYGLLAILSFLFLSRPERWTDRLLYLTMTILVMLNTGIGTYLFILFGSFSLIEQRQRNRGPILSS